MAIFKIDNQKLTSIKEKKIDLEREVQSITENNLDEVFGLKFVCSEFQLNGLRIDTLAWNEEGQSFIIIEYKKDRSFSVVDQGYAYLALMLNNKADFILEYNEKSKNSIKRDDVDWSQSRVIFIANSFTTYQQNAINFRDLPIELWEVKKYDDNLILYNQLKSPDSSESIKTVSKDKTVANVTQEIKTYVLSDHIKLDWIDSKELFESFREKILALDDRIIEKINKHYIGYYIGNSMFLAMRPQKAKLILELLRVKPEELNDPEKRTKYKKDSFKFFHKHVTLFDIEDENDIGYSIFLSKQIRDKQFLQ